MDQYKLGSSPISSSEVMVGDQLELQFVMCPEKLEVVSRTRPIVERFLVLDGQEFELERAYTILREMESDNEYDVNLYYGDNKRLVMVLRKYDVIRESGKGLNFDKFSKMVHDLFYNQESASG